MSDGILLHSKLMGDKFFAVSVGLESRCRLDIITHNVLASSSVDSQRRFSALTVSLKITRRYSSTVTCNKNLPPQTSANKTILN